MPSILQQVAQGDDRAVARCVEEYGGLVWRLATRYLGESRADTEDAVQEVFVALWLNAGRFDPSKGSEPAFVATIAHRRLTDAQRRRLARREVSEVADRPAPDRLTRGGEEGARAAVTAVFDRLPQDERQALWMAVWGGLSHRQIAEATGTALGTVKTRLRRGLRRMYESLHAVEPTSADGEGRP